MDTQALSQDAALDWPGTSSTTEILQFLREYARNFLNSRLLDERRSVPPGMVSDFAGAGLLGLQVSRRHGGQDLSHVDMNRVFTQLGAIDANLAVFCAVHNTLGISPILLSATEEVQDFVLPRLAKGQALTTSAISEPGMGSHVRGMTTEASRNADGSYTLDGAKKWISLGGDARYVNVFAQLRDERRRPVGITGFLVDTRTPGFEIGPEMLTLGLRAVPQYDLHFDNVRVPPSALLGAEGDGLATAKAAFMGGRVVLAAMSVGAAMRSLELAQRFTKGREVATGSLAENGRIRETLAEAGAGVQAVETLVSRIATWLDAGRDVPDAWYFCAKILGCELGWSAIDTALQVLAARGFLDTNTVGQHFRDYRLFRIFEGSTEAIAVYLGTMLVRNPAEFTKLVNQTQPTAQVLDLIDQVAEIGADRPGDAAGRHIHAALVGELSCWALLTMVTSEVAHRSAMHAYTASWTEHQLQQRLYRARLGSHRHLPTAAEFADHVAGYADTIGDVDQRRWPGEEWRADPLLRSRGVAERRSAGNDLRCDRG
ncbi:acyl-CoA dehydrogenase family protein [Actinoplanes friuliensis]|uniref:Acyl-CoA dehydrogenase domain-containing protein n=1 Tax=Actinoplanes friuliensis DSM 7358 TaxID=1246995 RepID=U5VZ14_9ACTN|nr:acyl-CoA dehydrogenase family protein [Actinoplanes friuliensis]AGZ40970.1 acyl-CoA dehydrogenase domain-containing protein [Actinoplanes friuliensis DSM 7358]